MQIEEFLSDTHGVTGSSPVPPTFHKPLNVMYLGMFNGLFISPFLACVYLSGQHGYNTGFSEGKRLIILICSQSVKIHIHLAIMHRAKIPSPIFLVNMRVKLKSDIFKILPRN